MTRFVNEGASAQAVARADLFQSEGAELCFRNIELRPLQ